MMNKLKVKDKEKKYEGEWVNDPKIKKKDINGKYLPFPEKFNWVNDDKQMFVNKLINIQNISKKIYIKKNINKNCVLCGKNNIFNHYYELDNIRWQDGLYHYVDIHNVKITNDFSNFINNYKIENNKIKYQPDYIIISQSDTLFFNKLAQLQYEYPIYGIYKYNKKYNSSFLLFNNKIIKNTLPIPIDEINDVNHILFKINLNTSNFIISLPSVEDINIFNIYKTDVNIKLFMIYNLEGIYIIKYLKPNISITLSQHNIEYINNIYNDINKKIIYQYKNINTIYKFYKKIKNDISFIHEYNRILNKLFIQIDFYPKIKINDVYLNKKIKLQL
jgi:hypothetical protein